MEIKMTAGKTLSPYGFTSYRRYLREYYLFRKGSERGYSYRMFSRAGGFSSPNILKLVMEGQRNLTPESTAQFIKALGLSRKKAEYFRQMVILDQSKTDSEKQEAWKNIKRLTPYSKKKTLKNEEIQYQYLSHWLHPVLRDMVLVQGFSDDPYWIASRINGRCSIKEIRSAFLFLLENGYIVRQGDRYETADDIVATSDEVRSLSIRQYHRCMLEQGGHILDDLEIGDREFGALTMVLPEESFEELKHKMKTFRQELHHWAVQVGEEKSGSSVVQVNMQMYPQTKRKVK